MDYRLHIWPNYVLEWKGGRISLTPYEGAIVSRLVVGRQISYDDLTDSIWGHDEEGGPEDPDNNLGVLVHRIRNKFKGSPFSIPRTRDRHVRLIAEIGAALDDIADNVLDEDA